MDAHAYPVGSSLLPSHLSFSSLCWPTPSHQDPAGHWLMGFSSPTALGRDNPSSALLATFSGKGGFRQKGHTFCWAFRGH